MNLKINGKRLFFTYAITAIVSLVCGEPTFPPRPQRHVLTARVRGSALPHREAAQRPVSAAAETPEESGVPPLGPAGEECREGNITYSTAGKFYIVGKLEANVAKAGFQSDSASSVQTEGGQWRSSSEESWQKLQPVVECGDQAMVLHVRRRRAGHLMLDRVNESSIPLSQLLPQCGYSVHTTSRDLDLTARYDACHVTQEDNSLVLPLLWRGAPVKVSCPVPELRPSAVGRYSACCSLYDMTVTVRDLPSAAELRINVRGEWSPLVVLAEECGYSLERSGADVEISAPYLTCGMTVKEGKYTLHLQMEDKTLTIQCPVSTVDSYHPLSGEPKWTRLEMEESIPWDPPFFLAPLYYPHPTNEQPSAQGEDKTPLTSSTSTAEPPLSPRALPHVDPRPDSPEYLSHHRPGGTPGQIEDPYYYHYYHNPKIPLQPDAGPEVPETLQSAHPPVLNPNVQQSESVTNPHTPTEHVEGLREEPVPRPPSHAFSPYYFHHPDPGSELPETLHSPHPRGYPLLGLHSALQQSEENTEQVPEPMSEAVTDPYTPTDHHEGVHEEPVPQPPNYVFNPYYHHLKILHPYPGPEVPETQHSAHPRAYKLPDLHTNLQQSEENSDLVPESLPEAVPNPHTPTEHLEGAHEETEPQPPSHVFNPYYHHLKLPLLHPYPGPEVPETQHSVHPRAYKLPDLHSNLQQSEENLDLVPESLPEAVPNPHTPTEHLEGAHEEAEPQHPSHAFTPYYHYYHPDIPLLHPYPGPGSSPDLPETLHSAHPRNFKLPNLHPNLQQSEQNPEQVPESLPEVVPNSHTPTEHPGGVHEEAELQSLPPRPHPYPSYYFFPHILKDEAKRMMPVHQDVPNVLHVHSPDPHGLNSEFYIDQSESDVVTNDRKHKSGRIKNPTFPEGEETNTEPQRPSTPENPADSVAPLSPEKSPFSNPADPNPHLYPYYYVHYYQHTPPINHGPENTPDADNQESSVPLLHDASSSLQEKPSTSPPESPNLPPPHFYYYYPVSESKEREPGGSVDSEKESSTPRLPPSTGAQSDAAKETYPSMPQPRSGPPQNSHPGYTAEKRLYDLFWDPGGEKEEEKGADGMRDCTTGHYFILVLPDPLLTPTSASADPQVSCALRKLTSDPDLYEGPPDGCGLHQQVFGESPEVLWGQRHLCPQDEQRSALQDSPHRWTSECTSPGEVEIHQVDQAPPPPVQTTAHVQMRVTTNESFSSFHPHPHLPLSLVRGRLVYLELGLQDEDPEPESVLRVHSCQAFAAAPYLSWTPVYDGCSSYYDSHLLLSPNPNHIVIVVSNFLLLTSETPLSSSKGRSAPQDDPEIYFFCLIDVCSAAEAPCSLSCTDSSNDSDGK